MQKFDVLIIGGGMVGLTLALAIRQQCQLTIAIVDKQTPEQLTTQPEMRVSAINIASQQIFSALKVWPLITSQRLQAYQHMHIWDKCGYGKLDFDANDFFKESSANKDLGWIIENKVIRNALWEQAQADNDICFITEQRLTNLSLSDNEVFASFDSGAPLLAKLAVGADGAHSWVRQQMSMPIAFKDYDHHALVAIVECEQGHNNTAWQVFLAQGPLALLPLFEPNKCSIVWSTTPDEATRLHGLTAEQFNQEITAASDGKLGRIVLKSELISFPLTMRLAHDFVKDKVVLVGDAAHTIHPLAGQGVNLGLFDAAALAEIITKQFQQQASINCPIALNGYSRWRKSEATEMIAAMSAIKTLFSEQPLNIPTPAAKLIRGIGMSFIDNFSPAKKMLIKQAVGFKSHLPDLIKIQDNLNI